VIIDLGPIDWKYVVHPSIAELESVEGYIHERGAPQLSDFSRPLWLTYQPPAPDGNPWGTISFLRRATLFWPELGHLVADHISHLLGVKLPSKYMSIIRSRGSVAPHVDEARVTSVNVGYVNTESARTICWDSTDERLVRSEFSSRPPDLEKQCEDRHAYLLDVSRVHAVISKDQTDRYLLSYPFNVPYAQVNDLLQRQSLKSKERHL
jgi:hypothetical protein